MRRTIIASVIALLAVVPTLDGEAAEKFSRLSGPQIKARFAGMDLSDDVHWRDSFRRNGTLDSQSMGRKRTGKWQVEKNELCIEVGKEANCYQVWMAGRKVELRREGLETPILEGTLQSPVQR